MAPQRRSHPRRGQGRAEREPKRHGVQQRKEPLTSKNGFVLCAEIMENFLFPFWQDAGLVTLSLGAVDSYYAARSIGLKCVGVTPLGRGTFSWLAEMSPRGFPRPEHEFNEEVALEDENDLDDYQDENDSPCIGWWSIPRRARTRRLQICAGMHLPLEAHSQP
jgi:hypothetical protein